MNKTLNTIFDEMFTIYESKMTSPSHLVIANSKGMIFLDEHTKFWINYPKVQGLSNGRGK